MGGRGTRSIKIKPTVEHQKRPLIGGDANTGREPVYDEDKSTNVVDNSPYTMRRKKSK